jgi:predicted metal-binding membrane protein
LAVATSPRIRPVPVPALVLLLAAALAWIGTVVWIRGEHMGAAPGTMGMAPVTFVAMWALMMAAMMLPSVWPFASVYAKGVAAGSTGRLTGLAAGYTGAWASTGVIAFGLAWTFGRIAQDHQSLARGTAVATFAVVGLYQLTPAKRRCLSHCRSPISHLLHYASFRGRFRDLRAGYSHGLFCLGCCWALMVMLVAFGVMNLAAMVGLAAIIGIEKIWRHGDTFAKVVGVAALAYAVALVFAPHLAPGLAPPTVAKPMGGM